MTIDSGDQEFPLVKHSVLLDIFPLCLYIIFDFGKMTFFSNKSTNIHCQARIWLLGGLQGGLDFLKN